MMKQINNVYLLIDDACNQFEKILDYFDVEYTYSVARVYGPCPVHHGDNNKAWNFYPDNTKGPRGIWMCYTNRCHNQYGKSFIGLLRGLLSNKFCKNVSFNEAVEWLQAFIQHKIKYDKLLIDNKDNQQFINLYSNLNNSDNNKHHYSNDKQKYLRSNIIKHLSIPAQYYINRKYKPYILQKYDVGLYTPQSRVIVPIYDDTRQFAVGFTKRAIYDNQKPKWLHSKGLKIDSLLYNSWFAQKYIKKTHSAIIVEGPGDVWRLEEAGIHNSLAVFTNRISNMQICKLLSMGVTDIIILMDNDEAGKKGKQEAKQKLSPFMRLHFVEIDKKDVGEMNVEEINSILYPYSNILKREIL